MNIIKPKTGQKYHKTQKSKTTYCTNHRSNSIKPTLSINQYLEQANEELYQVFAANHNELSDQKTIHNQKTIDSTVGYTIELELHYNPTKEGI